jgi:hypothetical protein
MLSKMLSHDFGHFQISWFTSYRRRSLVDVFYIVPFRLALATSQIIVNSIQQSETVERSAKPIVFPAGF